MLLINLLFARHRHRLSPPMLIIGALITLMACPMMVFGVPYTILRAGEIGNLPQPDAAALSEMPSGTLVLARAQIPADALTDEHGLALARVETATRRSASGENRNTAYGDWRTETHPPAQILLQLRDGQVLTTHLSTKTQLINAEVIEVTNGEDSQKWRHTGYIAAQTLTLEGAWEGEYHFSATALYAGSPAAYVEYANDAPWMVAFGGLSCLAVGIMLLVGGAVFWLMGR